MSHHVDDFIAGGISALYIDDKHRSESGTTYARITKLGSSRRDPGGKGIRIKVRRKDDDSGAGPLDITGEDLFALREFLAELPEEAFVRPADPVPPRWTDGDIVEEIGHSGRPYIWVRDDEGTWTTPKSSGYATDAILEQGLRDWPKTITIIRQKSGRGLS